MSRSRPNTSQPRSRHQGMSRHRFLPKLNKPGRDLKMMSRPQVQQARSRRQSNVATSWTTKPMSRHQVHVATSIPNRPGHDVNSMSRPPILSPMSRHQSMSRRRFCPTKADQVATSIPCHDLLETNLCRDINFMSRPPTVFPRSQHEFHVATKDPSVLTSARSRHQLLQSSFCIAILFFFL